jgi:hypothetical protein
MLLKWPWCCGLWRCCTCCCCWCYSNIVCYNKRVQLQVSCYFDVRVNVKHFILAFVLEYYLLHIIETERCMGTVTTVYVLSR